MLLTSVVLANTLIEIAPAKSWQINNLRRGGGFELYATTIEVFEKFREAFEQQGIPHFTHRPKTKTATVIMKGLSHGISDEEIQQALEEENDIRATKVTTVHARGRPSPLKREEFIPSNPNTKKIWSLRTLYNHKITVEEPIPQGEPICYKCSEIGHLGQTCHITSGPSLHCSHCGEEHVVTDCPDVNDSTKKRCHRCGSGEHRATY